MSFSGKDEKQMPPTPISTTTATTMTTTTTTSTETTTTNTAKPTRKLKTKPSIIISRSSPQDHGIKKESNPTQLLGSNAISFDLAWTARIVFLAQLILFLWTTN